ncbi:hypothetical protein ABID56_002232 [Alkalibacillus flavidus]|uniref:DUF3006 domain-containing protein n=1 Tax=Alkalibacillus flavidus TaxID=546021 RepID=A0ABV2KX00_9BACI
MVRGVLDEVNGDTAVILVESERTTYHIGISELPEDVAEGDWLQLTIEDGAVTHIMKDEQKTTEQQSKVSQRMKQLKSKKGSQYKR